MKLIHNKIFCAHRVQGCFWFRVFGSGLHFKDVRQHGLTFSEREGFVRRLSIGWLSVRFLAAARDGQLEATGSYSTAPISR